MKHQQVPVSLHPTVGSWRVAKPQELVQAKDLACATAERPTQQTLAQTKVSNCGDDAKHIAQLN
jgi:hypothetical protein